MKWQRIGTYAIRCEPWTVSRALVKGNPVYQLWHDKRPVENGSLGCFKDAEGAKAEAARLEKEWAA